MRSAEGKATQLALLAAELVRLKVDVTIADQTPAAIAARQAASTIAIVFSFVGDPLGTKLAWGNATGMSAGSVEITGKSVELVRELLPTQRIAVLGNVADPFTKPYVEAIGDACGRVGMQMGGGDAPGGGFAGARV